MRPSASGFGFGGAAGCAGAPPEGNAAQSVRSDGDRSFGFWPRTTSRGKACADESAQAVASLRDLIFEGTAQAVAVTLRPLWFELRATPETGCAGGAAQAVVSLRDIGFEGVGQAVLLGDVDAALLGDVDAVLFGDVDLEEVDTEVMPSRSSFSAASSASSSDSSSESASESSSSSSSHSSSWAVASLCDA